MTQVESLTVHLETELVLPLVFKPESRTWKARARCYGVCDRVSELQLGDADGRNRFPIRRAETGARADWVDHSTHACHDSCFC
jgi:hypothetical protein